MDEKAIKSYSKEFKLLAVKMRIEENRTYRSIAKELHLANQSYVHKWVSKYEKFGEAGLEDKRGCNTKVTRDKSKPKTLSIEEENLKLRAENEYLKKLLMVGRRDVQKR